MNTLEKLWAKHRATHAARSAAATSPALITPQQETTGGPGTQLRRLLASIGIHPRGEACKCNERAREMDERGPEWCTENMDSILDWLEEEAHKRPLTGFLFSRMIAKRAVQLAIRRAH